MVFLLVLSACDSGPPADRTPMRVASSETAGVATGPPTTSDTTTTTPATGTDIPSDTSTSGPTATTTPPAALLTAGLLGGPRGPVEVATVVKVVDGDTIHVLLGGQEYPLRFVGMDTPETRDPQRPVGYCGHEASSRTAELLPPGTRVRLERDVSETDEFGRLLRYVWLDGDVMVGAELVAEGLAVLDTVPPDVAWADTFVDLQHGAREAGLGVWGEACEPVPTLEPTTATPGDSGTPTASPGVCDPAYPDVCIPPPPPDLDCADIPYRRFRVLPPDPQHFDADGNGYGCEHVPEG